MVEVVTVGAMLMVMVAVWTSVMASGEEDMFTSGWGRLTVMV